MDKSSLLIPVRDMVFIALFTAVLCAVSPFSIAIGPIPLSFATLVIYLAAGTLGWKYGTLSVILYVMLGAFGLPVFSGFGGGFQKIAGPTGGFIIGYIPLALATGISAKFLSRYSDTDQKRLKGLVIAGLTRNPNKRCALSGGLRRGGRNDEEGLNRDKYFTANRWLYVLGMAIGTVLLYTCGVAWFMLQTKTSLLAAFMACVVPFLIGDTIKIIISCIVAPQLRTALRFAK